jgi:hypothetical protein
VSLFAVVLLVAAVALIVATEWRRLSSKLGFEGRRTRERARRKDRLRLLSSDRDDDDFVRAVERDLAALPTIDDHERR